MYSLAHQPRLCAPFLQFHVPFVRRHLMTVSSARVVLGLSTAGSVSPKELKEAYFKMAKECHPDSTTTSSAPDAASRFIHLTDAYEYLRDRASNKGFHYQEQSTFVSNASEEEDYRRACNASLGLSAEIVEESKRCPLFRQWLRGRSDSASVWNSFLMLHGGLAPRLEIRKSLSSSCEGSIQSSDRRRRRKD